MYYSRASEYPEDWIPGSFGMGVSAWEFGSSDSPCVANIGLLSRLVSWTLWSSQTSSMPIFASLPGWITASDVGSNAGTAPSVPGQLVQSDPCTPVQLLPAISALCVPCPLFSFCWLSSGSAVRLDTPMIPSMTLANDGPLSRVSRGCPLCKQLPIPCLQSPLFVSANWGTSSWFAAVMVSLADPWITEYCSEPAGFLGPAWVFFPDNADSLSSASGPLRSSSAWADPSASSLFEGARSLVVSCSTIDHIIMTLNHIHVKRFMMFFLARYAAEQHGIGNMQRPMPVSFQPFCGCQGFCDYLCCQFQVGVFYCSVLSKPWTGLYWQDACISLLQAVALRDWLSLQSSCNSLLMSMIWIRGSCCQIIYRK